jgi:adenine phosphoribosyltransferase
MSSAVEKLIRDRLRDVADYPIPGIVYKDITPLLGDAATFATIVEALADAYRSERIDKVVGIEARGFILAAPVARSLGAGFVPMRKKGKLPWTTYESSYVLEYGTAIIEVHRDAFAPGDRVLIVDDVLATGGTAAAALALVERGGATTVGLTFLIELQALNGRTQLPDGLVRTLYTV